MFIRSELAWVLHIPVPCANCEKEFTEVGGRLVGLKAIDCPECGAHLSLNSKEWAEFRDAIKEFSVGKSAPIAQLKERS